MRALATYVLTFKDEAHDAFQLRVVHERPGHLTEAVGSARRSMPDPTLPLCNVEAYDHSTIGTLIGFHYRPVR